MAFVKSTNINSEENKLKFSKTSSFNKYLMCHFCEKKFNNRLKIEQHVVTCLIDRTCKWCKIVFKNRGNLVTHAYYIHGDKSVKNKQEPSNTCIACDKSFANNGALKYHIRRVHYNLVTKVPTYDNKKINQVWYERAMDTDTIVEITKSAHNILLIRKFNEERQVTIEERKILIDLTSVYHTGNSVITKSCEICNKNILERDFKKHYDEKHGKLKKHHCNNCNMTFKRLYFFVRHTCNKTRKKKGKLQCRITKIESLTPISV